MPITFCPNAIAWGDMATWVAAAIALAGSSAVFYLGWQAQRLATSQASQAEDARQREAFVLLRLMARDVVAILPKVEATAEWMNDGFTVDEFLRLPRIRESIAETFNELKLPMIESLLSRLHVLEPNFAEAAAHSLACLMVLQHISETCVGMPQIHEYQEEFNKRNTATLELMRTEINILLRSLRLLQMADLLHLQKIRGIAA